ncbi:MAG: 50S ribosomal protein L24 [Candidatus Peribacteraceae bacterium]|nr:50S ribosomal protein L24 [Candidatus Peribacteraceae bacterium]
MKLHTGDTVLVITGKDKGKTGSVLRILESENRVIIGGVNMRTRHVKKTFQQAGRILKYEAAISASNVMILDPKTGKPSRIGYKVDDKGKKTRISKISGEEVKAVKPKKEAKKKATEATEGTKVKEKTEEKGTKDVSPASGKKSPFWKRMGFGAGEAAAQGDRQEESRSKQDHTVPEQQSQVHRSGGRGS